MKRSASLALLGLLGSLAFAPPSAAVQYWCEAQGIYETCDDSAGYRNCRDRSSDGKGLASTEQQAALDAVQNCSGHMQRMIVYSNIGGTTSRIKSPCALLGCRAVEGEPAQQGPAQSYSSEKERHLVEGVQLLQAGDVQGAIARFEQARQEDPTDPEPYLSIAYAYELQEQWAQACNTVAQGIRGVGNVEPFRLAQVICGIYGGQYGAAASAGEALGRGGQNPDLRANGAFYGWIAASLQAGGLAPCGAFVQSLSQVDAFPKHDINPILGFLAANFSAPGAGDLIQAINFVVQNGPGAASELAAACGGG